jgi:tetratricopeptide (TPR) repeat protein
MMTCDTVERENIVERYLTGRLEPAAKEEWELHYFGCDRCAQQLETWSAVEGPLRSMAAEIRREIPQPKRHTWLWAGVGIAAVLLLAAGASRLLHTGPVAAPIADSKASERQRLVEIAQLDPPAYAPQALRGTDSKAELQFQKAMQFYQRRDYTEAIPGLRAALDLDSGAAAPRFFLGASYLLSGSVPDGIRELGMVAAGTSPFAEEAGIDLGKGYLLQGDKEKALETLRRVANLHGDFDNQANRLIGQIEGIR